MNKAERKGTLKHLAHELDLSVTTVSRALGGYDDVAESTRQRVADAAKRANYVPNSAGKMLVTGRSGFVGLLLPLHDADFIDPFLGEFIMGLSQGLQAHGRDLFMATAAANQSELDVLRHVVESGRADGIVLSRIAERDERVEYLLERNFPFVTHGRTRDHTEHTYSWIDTDGESAFRDAFDLLYGLGHRRFGLVSISEAMTFRHYRERGLQQAVEASDDNSVSLKINRAPRFDKAVLTQSIDTMLNDPQRPTAIIGLTDEIAVKVLERARALKIEVPGALSVVGFDNMPTSELAVPGLTTFDQGTRKTSEWLASALIGSLDGRAVIRPELIQPELVLRSSHAQAPDFAL